MARRATSRYGVTNRRTSPLRLGPHPDSPSEQGWRQWVRGSTRPLAVDLFCGAGGLSYGLEAAGYRIALAVDTDERSLESHRHNIAGRALLLDLAESGARDEITAMFDGVDVGLVAGGPPCQPFSRAGLPKIRSLVRDGARGGIDSRRELWRAFVELVEAIRPRAVLMENVPDMALGDGFVTVRTMIECLGDAGYETDARIVDTWRHGVPQHRQRLIVVGLRDRAVFEWPCGAARVTVRDAIGDLPVIDVAPDTALGAPTMAYGAVEASFSAEAAGSDGGASVRPISGDAAIEGAAGARDFAARAREGCVGENARVVHDHTTRSVRADDFEAFKLMDGHTLYSELPAELRRYRRDIFDDKYNRLGWDELSRTITAHLAKDGYWYIHPGQHRTLTVREAARIQTFPDVFRFAGCRSHQFEQIGNAVPPVLARQIGSAILRSLRGSVSRPASEPPQLSPAARRRFRRSMLRWSRNDHDARQTVTAAAAGEGRDRRWADLLAGPPSGIVASQPALRVACMVAGMGGDAPVSGSTARMELAKLIGFSDDATRLNLAVHALGSTVCKPKNPRCGQCPVSDVCAGSTDGMHPLPLVKGA